MTSNLTGKDPTACDYCQGIGRERDGGRCQNCGGNGLADGLVGYHPRFFSLHLGTICNGWQTADFATITGQVEAAAEWTRTAGMKLEAFTDLDRRKVRMMIQRQVLLGIEAGHFDDMGLSRESVDAIKADLERVTDEDLFAKGRPIL